jgi:hypothetical protein
MFAYRTTEMRLLSGDPSGYPHLVSIWLCDSYVREVRGEGPVLERGHESDDQRHTTVDGGLSLGSVHFLGVRPYYTVIAFPTHGGLTVIWSSTSDRDG